jgi:hypothetical protein
MTREEFEMRYAARSGVSVEWLRSQGQVVVRCGCGEDGCEGWAMVSKEYAERVSKEYAERTGRVNDVG